MKRGRIARIASTSGRSRLSATTRPSASSVSRSSPQRTVNRYVFCPSITKGTVLVASPSAIGRQPEASGSSVPACPARLALNRRLITDTACVEVIPTGLSSTTQPWTSCFSRLAWRCFFPCPASAVALCASADRSGEAPAADGASAPVRGPGSEPVCSLSPMGLGSSLLIVAVFQVALHVGRAQQLLDALGLAEALVEAEAEVGRELHAHAVRDLAAQVALVALERLQH